MNTNCQPPDCPCFCPSAALPLAVTLVPEGGPAVVIQVPIFGTQPFQVSIETNPLFPIAQVPIIASVQMVAGNTLLITTGIPAPNETLGNYAATLRICNPCGELIITVPIEVVADLTPVVSDCTLAQGVWTFENRTPTVGDTILAFTPAGCRALLPDSPLTVCAALQSFPTVVPAPVDTVFGQQGGSCVQFSIANLVVPASVCAALNALGPLGPLGPLAPTDEFVILRAGGCALATLTDVSVGFDICAALQNLPNAVVQPTAAFYGQQGGNCFEFLVADLAGVIALAPILAANGTCAAPIYSFAASPDSGMFYNGAAVVIGDDNCTDFISIGTSIMVQSGSFSTISVLSGQGSNIVVTTANNSGAGSPGGIFLTAGADNLGFGPGGLIQIVAGQGSIIGGSTSVAGGSASGAGNGGFVAIDGGSTGTGIGGSVFVSGGGAAGGFAGSANLIGGLNSGVGPAGDANIFGGPATAGGTHGNILFWRSFPQVVTFSIIGASGAWELAGNAGVAGQVITSNGPGLAPTWQVGGAFPILAPNGSCAAPSYSFTASPDSGMFYTGTAVRIGDDACTDFIEVGASINIQTAGQLNATAATNFLMQSSAITAITAGTQLVVSATGAITINTANTAAPANISITAGNRTVAGLAGSIFLTAGNSTAPHGGGSLSLFGGSASPGFGTLQGPNNAANIGGTCESAGATTVAGGRARIVGGTANTAGAGGDADVNAGQGITVGGSCQVWGGAGASGATEPGRINVQGGQLAAHGYVEIATGGLFPPRLRITGVGAWSLALNEGLAGQQITSNGPGVAPTWQANVLFPILAPNGTCAAPSYSFTASPDSGMFYTGTAVRISDDNCGDYIEVGASINIVGGSSATPSGISITAGSGVGVDGASVGVTGGAGATIGGGVSVVGGVSGAGSTGAFLSISGANGGDGGSFEIVAGTPVGGDRGFGFYRARAHDFHTGNPGAPALRFRVESTGDVIVFSPGNLVVQTDGGYRATGQTNGAGVSAGTLGNAPSAGDPAFWLPVNINGLNRFIPVWA